MWTLSRNETRISWVRGRKTPILPHPCSFTFISVRSCILTWTHTVCFKTAGVRRMENVTNNALVCQEMKVNSYATFVWEGGSHVVSRSVRCVLNASHPHTSQVLLFLRSLSCDTMCNLKINLISIGAMTQDLSQSIWFCFT